MMMQIPRFWVLMLVASVLVCVTFGQQYKGKGCGSRRDPCDGYYCANGGSCILGDGYGYRYSTPTCQCIGDWTGDRCDATPCRHECKATCESTERLVTSETCSNGDVCCASE